MTLNDLENANHLVAQRQDLIEAVESWGSRTFDQGHGLPGERIAFGIVVDEGIERVLSSALWHELYRRIATLTVELQRLGVEVEEYPEPF